MHFNASHELQVIPFQGGVKFNPRSIDQVSLSSYPQLKDFLDSPCNVYILDLESKARVANEQMALALDLNSTKELIGKSVVDFCPTPASQVVIEHDNIVIKSKQRLINEESTGILPDGSNHHFLSIKTPIFNENNHVAGILGCSVRMDKQPLAISLSFMSKFGLLSNQYIHQIKNCIESQKICDIHFTQRQSDIIKLTVRGHSASQIGNLLGLSKRTVEHYLEEIKYKLTVSTKVELIEKVLNFLISDEFNFHHLKSYLFSKQAWTSLPQDR